MGVGDLKPQPSCLLFIYLQWFLCSPGYKISNPDFPPHIPLFKLGDLQRWVFGCASVPTGRDVFVSFFYLCFSNLSHSSHSLTFGPLHLTIFVPIQGWLIPIKKKSPGHSSSCFIFWRVIMTMKKLDLSLGISCCLKEFGKVCFMHSSKRLSVISIRIQIEKWVEGSGSWYRWKSLAVPSLYHSALSCPPWPLPFPLSIFTES